MPNAPSEKADDRPKKPKGRERSEKQKWSLMPGYWPKREPIFRSEIERLLAEQHVDAGLHSPHRFLEQ